MKRRRRGGNGAKNGAPMRPMRARETEREREREQTRAPHAHRLSYSVSVSRRGAQASHLRSHDGSGMRGGHELLSREGIAHGAGDGLAVHPDVLVQSPTHTLRVWGEQASTPYTRSAKDDTGIQAAIRTVEICKQVRLAFDGERKASPGVRCSISSSSWGDPRGLPR